MNTEEYENIIKNLAMMLCQLDTIGYYCDNICNKAEICDKNNNPCLKNDSAMINDWIKWAAK